MNKVIVIGCPGSGKTTFAEKLNKCTGLPLYYLDAIWHKPDKTHIPREEFDERITEIPLVPPNKRPEKALLKLRHAMGVYSNNRPAKIWQQLSDASPLKKEIVEKGIDFIIVRELTGGIYFGEHSTKEENGELVATDVLCYSEKEIERIGRIAFETARKRNKKLCSVEKSNVLDSSRLWKKVMHRLSLEYKDIELSDMLVDNCAMQIVKDPAQFDVIVTENMFGDILSDEASMITGSIGMIPSSSLGSTFQTCFLYLKKGCVIGVGSSASGSGVVMLN